MSDANVSKNGASRMKLGDLSKREWIWLSLFFPFGLCYFLPGFGAQWHTPIYAVAHVFGFLALATAPRNARGWVGVLCCPPSE